MFYIYHIPNVKIGMSKHPNKRVRQQGYTDYEILETHEDIHLCSAREIELQKEYGYQIDRCPYVIANYSNAGRIGGRTNVSSGHINKIQSIGCSLGGKVQGDKNVKSGHIKNMAEKSSDVRSLRVGQYDKCNNLIRTWKNARRASIHLNLSYAGINNCCRGVSKSSGGYIWKYL